MNCLHQKVFHMNEKKKNCLTERNIDIDIPTFEEEIKKEDFFDGVSLKDFILPKNEIKL